MSWRPFVFAGLICLLATSWLSASVEFDQAISLHQQGRLREALEAYSQAARLLVDENPSKAAAARNNACVIRIGFSEYEEALIDCTEAVRLRKQLDDEARLARALNNLGIIQQNLGSYDQASMAFLEALGINESRGDTESQVFNLSNLGTLESIQGRYAEALEHHNRAARLVAANPDADWAEDRLRVTLINLGVVLEKIGAFEESLNRFQKALDMPKSNDPRETAQLLVNIGVVYRNLGDPVAAIERFAEARLLFIEAEDRSGVALAELNLAHAYRLNLARPKDAELAYRRALQIAVEIADRPLEIESTYNLGRFLIELDRFDEATVTLGQCLDLSEKSGSSEGRWSCLAGLGSISARQKDPEKARDLYARAVNEIDRVREEISAPAHRTDYFSDKRQVYEEAAQILVGLIETDPSAGHDREAFELVQRAKYRTLRDALDQTTTFRSQTVEEISASLGSTRILEYFVAAQDLLLFVIDGEGLRLFNLGPAEETLLQIENVYKQLANGDESAAGELEALSNRLLPEGASDVWQAGTVRIAPDTGLSSLPFELLRDPTIGGRLLIDQAEISYIPSALSIGTDEFESAEVRVAVVGFANPHLGAESTDPDSAKELMVSRLDLPALPSAEAELESLERWLPKPQVRLVGAEATESAYRESVAVGVRVAHVAAHSVIDDRLGLGPAILLSPDGVDDGLLTPREIANIPGRVGLSVLAACSTVADPGRGAGGLETLTGALLAGGSSAVLATLWDVGDQPTAVFMEQFYYYIGQGLAASEALRLAKLRLREDDRWASPTYWAPYVLTGDVTLFSPPPGKRWLKIAVIAAVILMSFGLARLYTSQRGSKEL